MASDLRGDLIIMTSYKGKFSQTFSVAESTTLSLFRMYSAFTSQMFVLSVLINLNIGPKGVYHMDEVKVQQSLLVCYCYANSRVTTINTPRKTGIIYLQLQQTKCAETTPVLICSQASFWYTRSYNREPLFKEHRVSCFLDLEHPKNHKARYRLALVLSRETTKPGVF
jgi:hypothetical protein